MPNKLIVALLPLAHLLALAACPINPTTRLELPQVPRALSELNTPYNDFNSTAPDSADGTLVFSTDRASRGAHFDLWKATLHFSRDRVSVDSVAPFEPAAMSAGNEIGPSILDTGELVFASDRPGGAGGLDLYRWRVRDEAIVGQRAAVASALTPMGLPGINSEHNEAYWTLNADYGEALFASDREGRGYDAYQVNPPYGAMPGGAAPQIERVAALSSDADDTAFFVFRARADGNTYVLFASNRAGGQGHYDLYCSRRAEQGWDAPKPLAYASSLGNDFRPIIFPGYHRDVLLFSSDRPGGRGSMDLYYAELRNPCSAQ